jgi:hypothetical protein
MSSLSHVLSSLRQQSFVPDGEPAKLILGLGSTTKCHSLFRTAAGANLSQNGHPIFIDLCGRETMLNYFAPTSGFAEPK